MSSSFLGNILNDDITALWESTRNSTGSTGIHLTVIVTLYILLWQSSVQKTWADAVWARDGLSGPHIQEAAAWGTGYRGTQHSWIPEPFGNLKGCACNCLFPSFLVQIVRTFSLKGMTNKLFGQEAPEQREARLKLLEELIAEGEEAVKEKTVECEWVLHPAQPTLI